MGELLVAHEEPAAQCGGPGSRHVPATGQGGSAAQALQHLRAHNAAWAAQAAACCSWVLQELETVEAVAEALVISVQCLLEEIPQVRWRMDRPKCGACSGAVWAQGTMRLLRYGQPSRRWFWRWLAIRAVTATPFVRAGARGGSGGCSCRIARAAGGSRAEDAGRVAGQPRCRPMTAGCVFGAVVSRSMATQCAATL